MRLEVRVIVCPRRRSASKDERETMDYLIEPSRAPRPRPENVIVKPFSEDRPHRTASQRKRRARSMSKPIWFWCHVDRVVLEIVESLWAVGTDSRSGGLPGGAEGNRTQTPDGGNGWGQKNLTR